ncbi:MAG: glycosyltransferase [Flavobacteriia bacterium]|nr:glycosyltransferase [Flavobacteriia bacterium]
MKELLPLFQQNLIFYVFCFFCLVVLIQFIYVLFFYTRLAFYKEKVKENTEFPPVSVIIAARNEEENLYRYLPLILEQDYPEFEVLVVNHQSIDDSYQVLNTLKMTYPNKLKVIEVERSKHLGSGKKFPLSLGIKIAKYQHLVLTDADCEPSSKKWLALMSGKFSEQKQLIIGFAPYRKKNGWLNRLIRFDALMIAMNYLSFALARVPYMGVGRNLAYTKKLYESVNGFKSHYSIISGDDDLFIQEVAKNKNYCIQIHPDSYCYSEGKDSWSKWMIQKSRHYSASSKYKVIKKYLLGIYPLSLIFAWICFVILLLDMEYRWLSGLIFVFIILLKWWIQGKCLAKLKNNKFIWFLPISDLLYALFTPFVYYSFDKNKIARWK